jgi:hypothetical protein
VGGVNRRIFLLATLALGGCASAPAAPPTPAPSTPGPTRLPTPTPVPPTAAPQPPAPLAELEPLYSLVAGRDGLAIQVSSHGCTSKADFTFYVQRRSGFVSLAFARRRVDACKTLGRAEITFTWAELGLDARTPVFLLNPIGGAP